MNIERQVQYWVEGAESDGKLAMEIIQKDYTEQGLFFTHLSMEKLLKAMICKQTSSIAPRIHNLLRLAEKAGLLLNKEQTNFMAELNNYNQEGRYPSFNNEKLSIQEATELQFKAEE